MHIIPHGAAKEVTGSCHEIRVNGKRILLDCGLFQGHREEAAMKNSGFEFDPTQIDAMILSHAHMDHVGRVPVLWRKGFKGNVHCTYATKDLAAVMLQDGGFIQEKDEEYFCKHLAKSMVKCDGPLYTQKDAADCMAIFKGENYGTWFDVVSGVRAKFLDAGHILGAAMIVLEITENGSVRHIGFSGDLGRNSLPILRDPEAMPPVDTLICESTYGDRIHTSIDSAQGQLAEVVTRTAERGGKILIPAFSLERTQEILYDLHVLWDEKKIPAVPIFIDSPLASRVTDVFQAHPECYDKEMYDQFLSKQHNPFQFSLATYTDDVEESKALNGRPGPFLVMAGSGMCEAGRIRHHLKNELEDSRNTVLAVGYMAQHTLGAKIVDPEVVEVRIFDKMYRKNADVVYIDAYSGHADKDDLDGYVSSIEGLKNLILVHGEEDQMLPFADRMQNQTGANVIIPDREQEIEI